MSRTNKTNGNNPIVQCEIVFTNILFPKGKLDLEAGTWISARGKITKVIQGKEILQEMGVIFSRGSGIGTNISIRGNICAFHTIYDIGKPFKITANIIEDEKWGVQFDILFLNSLDSLEDKEGQRKFLSTILTPSQIDLLYKSIEDPFEIIANGDIESLIKIKGIGSKTASNIIERFERNKDNSKAYVELYDLGLTKNRIDNLITQFKSPDVLVDIIKENPYKLIELADGFGWENADTLALNSGIHPLSEKRIEAYIFYFLRELGYGEGSTWVEFMELYNIIIDKFPELHPDKEPTLLIDCIKRMLKKVDEDSENEKPRLKLVQVPTGAYDNYGREITFKKLALYHNWELESNVVKELLRIQGGELLKYENPELSIKNTEEQQGFEFTEEQKEGIKTVLENQVSIVTGRAGCVDKDTEFFNGKEWKKISEYKQGDKVLQYNEDGTAELVEPLAYIKQPSEWLWHFKTKYGLNQCLSDDHRVVYVTSKGNLYEKPMREVVKRHDETKQGFSGKFITSFQFNGKGINLTDAEIKLMLAVICDGSFIGTKNPDWISKTTWCRVNIKKEHKKVELERILQECNIEYKKYKWNKKDRQYNTYTFYAPIRTKTFPKNWYNCSQEQLQLIADNILQWDGSERKGRKTFSTTVKENADFVQWVFTTCGHRASISSYDRRGTKKVNSENGKVYTRKSIEYTVTITARTLISMGNMSNHNKKTPIKKYKTLDGYEYCFTVPSSMLILRRNDKIFATGNCGKTSVVRGMLSALPNYNVELTSPTGQAASRLSYLTNSEGKTIHRLLQYVQRQGFIRNESNQLTSNIIILDEVSMVDLNLFYALLKAIPTGAKLVMVGDYGQLPSIGLGNLFKDLIESKIVPTTFLTQIHRQSAKSGIITEALKVSNGTQLVPNGTITEEIRGQLQDFKLITYREAVESQDFILNEFRRLYYEEKVPIENIQIIVPLRQRGGLSTNYLNPIIQEMVNPDKPFEDNIKVEIETNEKSGNGKYKYYLKVNDKIRINTNTYRRIFSTEDRSEIPVFNGNLGTIKEINLLEEEIILDLGYIGTVIVPKPLWNIISLSYVSSCHASQGSEFPYVIVGLDYSAYTLLNRNWIYTAITRSKKECILCAQETALRFAISQSAIDNKRTFLKDLLIYETQMIETNIKNEEGKNNSNNPH